MVRFGMIRTAAIAALAICGVATFANAEQTAPSALSLKPVYLEDAAAPASSDGALMQLLGKAGVAGPLKEAGISIGGHVEGSYTYAFDRPSSKLLTARVFDLETEDPTLNQLMFFAEKTVDNALAKGQFDIGFRAEMMWGADARFIHSLGLFDHYGFGDGPDNQWDLTQAYVDFALPVGTGLKVRVGKFVTLAGQETINPTGNALYSHSFLFGYAIPFTHTGVLATYNLSDTLTIDAGVTRGWDTSTEDNNDTLSFIGRLTAKMGPNTTGYFTLISGKDQAGDNDNWRHLIDVIIATKVGDNMTVALNGDYGYQVNDAAAGGSDSHWWGVAGYLGYTLCPNVTLNARGEYFNDDDGVRLGVGGVGAFEATVGLSIIPFPNSALGKNLVIRPEVRYDYATKGIFDGDHDQWSAAIDAYFKF